MPKVEHLIQKDQNIRLIGWNTHLLQGTFLWKFTAVNYRVILIVTCIGSGIWKSFKVFCETISLCPLLQSFYRHYFIAWRKKLCWFSPAKLKRIRITFSQKNELSSLLCSQYFLGGVLPLKALLLFSLYCYTMQASLALTLRQQNVMTRVTNHLLQVLSFRLHLWFYWD